MGVALKSPHPGPAPPLGRLLSALDRGGVADRTLVYFTSDNGGWLEARAGGEQLGGWNGGFRGEHWGWQGQGLHNRERGRRNWKEAPPPYIQFSQITSCPAACSPVPALSPAHSNFWFP